jgi:exodeoxyribonuclease V alpha subunit
LIEAKMSGGKIKADVVLIDESSMIDVSLMADLTRCLPEHACVVFVGDKDQLPSVGPGDLLKHMIESGRIPHASLRRIYRQKEGSSIPEVAQAVNEGVVPVLPEPGSESAIFMLSEGDPERVAEKVVATAAVWSRQRWGVDPWKDVQILSPMRRSVTGVEELNRRMQAKLNPGRPGIREVNIPGGVFREGDKVIQTTNNYGKEVFNGEIGRILAIEERKSLDEDGVENVEKMVVVEFPDRMVEYELHELDQLQLAYAVTVHKSQGSEFKVVVIPLTTQHAIMLQRKLVYTAITRGKQRVVLVGQKKALGMAVRNAMVRPRYSGLLEKLCGSGFV